MMRMCCEVCIRNDHVAAPLPKTLLFPRKLTQARYKAVPHCCLYVCLSGSCPRNADISACLAWEVVSADSPTLLWTVAPQLVGRCSAVALLLASSLSQRGWRPTHP